MSRRCELTGVGVQFGNNVSHSQRKTRRRFEPNIKVIKCKSDLTGQDYKLKVIARCIRSIEKAGGFDSFILNAKACKMSDKAKSIRKEIKKLKDGVSA
jgi:large subunit ribosomal protein L28